MEGADFLTGHRGSLCSVLSDWAMLDPDRPFCEEARTIVTYGEFNATVNRVALSLQRLGFGLGDAVAVLMPNCRDYLIAMLATHRIGAIHVPVNTYYTNEEITFQLQDGRVKGLIVNAEWSTRVNTIRLNCPHLKTIIIREGTNSIGPSWNDLVATNNQTLRPAKVRADDLATVMYSSGTTDRPKGIMFSHGNLVVAAHNMISLFGWTPSERFLHYYPMFQGNGAVTSIAPAILSGACLILQPRFSASQFGVELVDKRITFCHVSSTHVRMLMNTPATDADAAHGVRRMLLGLSLEDDEIRAFERRFSTRLCPIYGLTEVPGLVTATTPGELRKPATAGRARRGLTLRVLDEGGKILGPGEMGELVVHGDHRHDLTLGYLGDQIRTEESYRHGWLYTGDLGAIDEDGFFSFSGRKKDVIKRSGFSISPAEIERVIRELGLVADCAVVAAPDRIRGEAIVAFIVLRNPTKDVVEQVYSHCRDKLAEYKVPQVVEVVSDLPHNFLGKVDRVALRNRALKFAVYTDHRTPLGGPDLPKSETSDPGAVG
jgi:acyl-CoA synthetase (AMP-forming)/AMP-acid ligase II